MVDIFEEKHCSLPKGHQEAIEFVHDTDATLAILELEYNLKNLSANSDTFSNRWSKQHVSIIFTQAMRIHVQEVEGPWLSCELLGRVHRDVFFHDCIPLTSSDRI